MNNIIEDKPQKITVIFDGICILCNGFIQWIIKRDKAQKFEFYSIDEYIKSDNPVQDVLSTIKHIDSVVVIENFKIHTKSGAMFVIVRNVHSWAKILLIFRFLSTKLLDKVYDYIARNRYKWFGKTESCKI